MEKHRDNHTELYSLAMEKMFDHIPASMYIKDKNYNYVWCNKFMCNMFGIETYESLKYSNDYSIIPKGLVEKLRQVDMEVIEKQEIVTAKELVYLSDGSMGWFLSHKIPIIDSNKQSLGLLGISFDLGAEFAHAKRTAAAENLSMRDKSFVQKFFSNVHHEIRTPLSIINMSLQCINDIHSGDLNQHRDSIDKILANTLRLKSALEFLTDPKCLEDYEWLIIKPQKVNFGEFLKGVLADYSSNMFTRQNMTIGGQFALDKNCMIDIKNVSAAIRAILDHMNSFHKLVRNIVISLSTFNKEHAEWLRLEFVAKRTTNIKHRDLAFAELEKSVDIHALGLHAAHSIVKQHGGELSYRSEKGECQCVILLPAYF